MSLLPYSATKVVDASIELTVAQKWLWFAIWQLDRGPERAFISATLLARRKGVGVTYVEQLRRELKALGLLASGPRPGRSGTTWWPMLPSQCIPPGQRTSDDQVFALADRLDGFLRVAKDDANDSEPVPAKNVTQDDAPSGASRHTGVRQRSEAEAHPGAPAQAHPGMPSQPLSSPASLADEGRVGRGAPSSSQRCETTLPPQVRTKEDGGKAEEGARARAGEEDGAVPARASGNWREVMRTSEARAARARRPGS